MIILKDVNKLVSLVNNRQIIFWNVNCNDLCNSMCYTVLYDCVNDSYFVHDNFKNVRLHTVIVSGLFPLSSFVLHSYYVPYDCVYIGYVKDGFLSHCGVCFCSYGYFPCQRVKGSGVSYFISSVSKSFKKTRVCQDVDYVLSLLRVFNGYLFLYDGDMCSSVREFHSLNDSGVLGMCYEIRIK